MQKNKVKKLINKTQQDYESIADHFSNTRVKVWPEMLELKKYVQSGDKILDLGCGNGRLYQILKDLDIDYVGLDVSSNLIKIAQARFKSTSVKFIIGDMTHKLPFKDQTFDIIFCIASFHHIPSCGLRKQVLTEFKRIIRPGGYLIMINWNLRKLKLILKYNLWQLPLNLKFNGMDKGDTLIPWKSKNKVIKRYYHAFTLKELERLFKQTDWQTVKQYKVKNNLVSVIKNN